MKNIHLFFSLMVLILLTKSCQNEPAFSVTTNEFIIDPEFEITAIAAEPLLNSPVAMSFDHLGRIWVVELPGYMRDIDGSDENAPDGKIIILEDENEDGIMDTRSVFLDNLITPRTLLHAYGGLLYSESTNLWWAKLSDTKIIEQVLVDSLYVVGGNIEHQPNGLLYHVDNWIYSANSKARYRFKNGTWLKEPTSFRGQWGLSADQNGRLFYNNNSLPLATDYLMPNQLIDHPFQKLKFSYSQSIAADLRIHALQATAVNRGYIEGVLNEAERIKEFTSACAPFIYVGKKFKYPNQAEAFVCAPEANLIKRYQINEKDGKPIATPFYEKEENGQFLISKDETFRPINLYNGADGAMYILDLRKGIIQHRAYMTTYLRDKILDKNLDSVNGLGRIYRIQHKGFDEPKAIEWANLKAENWVNLLSTTNGYLRNLAQKRLIALNAKGTKELLEKIATDPFHPAGQIQALWTLEGLNLLTPELLTFAFMTSVNTTVQSHLVRLSELFPEKEKDFIPYFEKIIQEDASYLQFQLAARLGKSDLPKMQELWLTLAEINRNNPAFCEALISGIFEKEEQFLNQLSPLSSPDSLSNFIKKVIQNKAINSIQSPKFYTSTFKDDRTAGFDLFSIHCASCHGLDGEGKDKLAPPMTHSEFVSGSKDRLITLVLNGLKGPIHVNGELYDMNLVMPGLKNNPTLSDKDIADLLVFVRNSFSFSDTYINAEDVSKWREATKDRDSLYTENELIERFGPLEIEN